ncbi:MAG: hypothetical protein AAF224_03370 [Pseudomonadota bacterium]
MSTSNNASSIAASTRKPNPERVWIDLFQEPPPIKTSRRLMALALCDYAKDLHHRKNDSEDTHGHQR